MSWEDKEPPHCPTCDCGVKYEAPTVNDSVPGWAPSPEIRHKLMEVVIHTGPHHCGDTAAYWYLVGALTHLRR